MALHLTASRPIEDEEVIDTRTNAELDESSAEEQAKPWYHVDLDWYAQHGLSFADVARARMDEACRAKIGTETEERVPVLDKATGRMKVEPRRTTYGSDPLKVIKEHCSRQKTYIHRDMPTLEAVFRIYLANGNQPMPLEHVRDQLSEWCPGGGCQWLMLPEETVQRLIENDRHYGFARAEVPALG